MNNSQQKLRPLLASLMIITGLSGCASTAPSADFTLKPPAQQPIDANDTITVNLDSAAKVEMQDTEKQRLSQLIASLIDSKKRLNSQAGVPQPYQFEVAITRYEKGNAFARFMLAGFGQIHIEAHIIVWSQPAKEKYAEFDIEKTFAWGGLIGASTHIEDVEPAFAEGIANAVIEAQP